MVSFGAANELFFLGLLRLLSIAEETLAEFLSKATGTAVDWVQMPGMKVLFTLLLSYHSLLLCVFFVEYLWLYSNVEMFCMFSLVRIRLAYLLFRKDAVGWQLEPVVLLV